MSIVTAVINNVPPSSSLGYTLYAKGAAISTRLTRGLVPTDGGAAGGTYSVLVDTAVTGADAVYWDTGGTAPQVVLLSILPPSPQVQAAVTINVPQQPNAATAALQIVQNGVAYGPFPATVSADASSGYDLTVSLASLPVGLIPGPVLVQAGDAVNGVFTATASLPAIAGILGSAAPVMFSVGSPVADIETSANTLLAGSDAVISVLVSLDNPQPGAQADPTSYPVTLILSAAGAMSGASYAGTWLSVPSGAYAGAWAQITLSSVLGTTLAAGVYNVFVLLGSTLTQQAGIIRVQPSN